MNAADPRYTFAQAHALDRAQVPIHRDTFALKMPKSVKNLHQ